MREELITILKEYENDPMYITGYIFELGTSWNMPEGYKIQMTEYEDSVDIFLVDNNDADNHVHLMFEDKDNYTISKRISDNELADEWIFQINMENRFTLEFSLIEE